jgi:hypothetical protein
MTRFALAYLLMGTVAGAAAAPAPQTPPAPATPATLATQTPAGGAAELYHVHFVKAAPGKLVELIDGYVNAPADPEAPAPPVILRHREGDDWNLLVLQPLGKEATLRAVPPSAELQQFLTRTRGLRAMHSDTFAIGPPWTEARKLVLGDERAEASASGGIYVVSVFRALPGHRDQLQDVLRKMAAEDAGRTVVLQHLEGAPWEFVMITRYESWAAFGESEQKLGGQAPGPTTLAMGEHLAEHHDTVAERITRAVPARQP